MGYAINERSKRPAGNLPTSGTYIWQSELIYRPPATNKTSEIKFELITFVGGGVRVDVTYFITKLTPSIRT